MNLNEKRYHERRVLKKQLKLICLLHGIFLKAEENFLKRKKLKLWKGVFEGTILRHSVMSDL